MRNINWSIVLLGGSEKVGVKLIGGLLTSDRGGVDVETGRG